MKTVGAGEPGEREKGAEQQVVPVDQKQQRLFRRRGRRHRLGRQECNLRRIRPAFYGGGRRTRPGRAGRRLAAALPPLLALLVSGPGCAGAEFSERHEIALDGGGRSLLRFAAADADLDALRAGLGAPGLTLVALREDPDGSVSAEVEFESLGALCASAALARECNYGPRPVSEGGYELWLGGLAPGAATPALPAPGPVEVRLGARVSFHNSPEAPQRGNLLSWPRGEDGAPPEIRVVTEGTSVLAYAVAIAIRSLLIAAAIIGGALLLVVRTGRRRLRAEAQDGGFATR